MGSWSHFLGQTKTRPIRANCYVFEQRAYRLTYLRGFD